MIITSSSVWINRVRLPIRSWSAEQGNRMFPCPRLHLRIWSRETSSAVPSGVSLLIFSAPRLTLLVPTRGIPPTFQGDVHYLYYQPTSGQSRVFQVTQLCTDGVHYRESAGIGSVFVRVVPVSSGAAFPGISRGQLMCASIVPHPLL